MKMIKEVYKKYEEIIRYLVVGVLTTIVSLATYFICVHTFLDATNGYYFLGICCCICLHYQSHFCIQKQIKKLFKRNH